MPSSMRFCASTSNGSNPKKEAADGLFEDGDGDEAEVEARMA